MFKKLMGISLISILMLVGCNGNKELSEEELAEQYPVYAANKEYIDTASLFVDAGYKLIKSIRESYHDYENIAVLLEDFEPVIKEAIFADYDEAYSEYLYYPLSYQISKIHTELDRITNMVSSTNKHKYDQRYSKIDVSKDVDKTQRLIEELEINVDNLLPIEE